MANVKFSAIAPSGSPAIGTDQFLGVHASTDLLFTPAQLQAALAVFTTAAPGLVPTSPGGTTAFLRADGTWQPPPVGNVTGGSNFGVAIMNSATSIASSVVLPLNNFLIGQTAANPIPATPAQVTALLPPFSTTTTAPGVVVGSNNVGNTFFLRADGTWQVPPSAGGGISGGVAHGVAITATASTITTNVLLGANQMLVGQAGADPIAASGATITACIGGNLSTLQSPGNWRSFYSNGSGAFTTLPLGTAGQIELAQSATSAPAWTTLSGDVASLSAAGLVTLSSSVLKANVTNTLTVGYTITPFNAGTIATGTFTPAPANGNYQFYTNNGAHTVAAPATDCAIDIFMTNGASAAIPGFSGFRTGPNIGDALTTANTAVFIISIRRVNAVATYTVKALQ